MGAFTLGTQVQPYGTSPNGTLVGNFWNAAASPIVAGCGRQHCGAAAYMATGGDVLRRTTTSSPLPSDMWNFFH